MSYRIKTVATLTGIPKSTLVAWERRYSVVEPRRSDNGYRVYSNEDVAVLNAVKGMIDEGYKVSEAIQLVRSAEPTERLQSAASGSGDDVAFADIRAEVLAGLVAFDRRRADQVARRLLTVSFREQLDHVWFPILQEVGHSWADERVSMVQEHFVTEYVREQLHSMLMSLQGGPPVGKQAVCVVFPGERHELGLLGVAIRLALNGWRVTFLGGDLPTEALCEFLRSQTIALLAVSVMYPQSAERLEDFARAVRAAADSGVRIVIGGAAISEATPLPPGVEWGDDVDALGSGR